MTRARVAWSIAIVDIVAFAVAVVADPPDASVVLYAIGIALFAGIGALLISRVPANVIGALLLATGTLIVVAQVVSAYAHVGISQVPPWPMSGAARAIGDTMFIFPIAIALIGIPLYFPDGRLPSPRFRWVVWITVVNMVVWTIEATRDVRAKGSATSAPGPDVIGAILDGLELYVLFAMLVGFGGAAVGMAIRFRRGQPVERQQIKWLLAVVASGAVVWPASFLLFDTDAGTVLNILGTVILFALPVVIGVAILRYHLYEIDRIISRSIGYLIVTGILAAVFVGAVLASRAVLGQFLGENPVGVAASTLIVAALFQPLRVRVQRAVDRRFNRARYDAERTVAAFSVRLRDDVDLESLRADVQAVVAQTVAPASMGLWMRPGGPGT